MDTTFGWGGYSGYFGVGMTSATSMTVLSNGNILVVGNADPNYLDGGQNMILLAEFHANGTLMTSFGVSGVAMRGSAEGDTAQALTVLPDGHILVAGYQGMADGTQEGVIFEYNANGTVNTSFGVNGVAVDAASTGWNAMMVLPNGNLVVGGGATLNSYFMGGASLVEYDPTGHFVSGFGSGGTMPLGFTVTALTLLGNGQILAAGYVTDYNDAHYMEVAVARVNADGTLDSSFGSSGTGGAGGGVTYVPLLLMDYYSTVSAITVLTNGEILIAGSVIDMGDDLMLAEFRSDGTLDTSFNGMGFSWTAMGFWAGAMAMTILPSGEVLVGGGIQMMVQQTAIPISWASRCWRSTRSAACPMGIAQTRRR